MQVDMHYYCIYALCRSVGFNGNDACKIAYSSQYVDDNQHSFLLKFTDHTVYRPVPTANRIISKKQLDQMSDIDTLMPFHFCPNNVADNTEKSYTVTPYDNTGILKLLYDDINNDKTTRQLHRLGILLHTIMDTYSHKDFIGFLSENNNVSRSKIHKWQIIVNRIVGKLIPIGHACIDIDADLPYKVFKYTKQKETIYRNNKELFINACSNVYDLVLNFIENNSKYRKDISINFSDIEALLTYLISTKEVTIEYRVSEWHTAISENKFNWRTTHMRDKMLYDETEWESAGLSEVLGIKYLINKIIFNEVLYSPSDFKGNWFLFMNAAFYHQKFILNLIYGNTEKLL